MVSLHEEHRGARAYEMTTVTPVTEAVAAVAIIVLTILGLVNVVPGTMMGVAVIVVGAAILLQGAQTVGEYSRVAVESGGAVAANGAGGGITLDFLAGGAGIVLGILSLFAHAEQFAPAALIVFGGTLLLSGGIAGVSASPTSRPEAEASPSERAMAAITRETSAIAAGAQVLVGIAAIVLGILALALVQPAILTLVGLLVVGGAFLMRSATVDGAALALTRSA